MSSVQVDPAAAAAASGSRLIVTTSQSLAEVDAEPGHRDARRRRSRSTRPGEASACASRIPLFDDTEYTVRVRGRRGLGGGPSATFTETFRTPPPDVFLLQRTTSGDTIYPHRPHRRRGGAGVPQRPHRGLPGDLEPPRRLGARRRRRRSSSSPTWTAALSATLPLPGEGYVSNLQSADRGELIGYTFSDADLGAAGGLESALFTASLKESEADAEPTPVAVTGADARVAEWRFVPDTDSILLLSFDGSLLLTGSRRARTRPRSARRSRSRASPAARRRRSWRGSTGCVVIDLSDAERGRRSSPPTRTSACSARSRRCPAAAPCASARRPTSRASRSGTTVALGGRRRRDRRADGAARRRMSCCRRASRRAGDTPRCSSRRMPSPTRTTATSCRCRSGSSRASSRSRPARRSSRSRASTSRGVRCRPDERRRAGALRPATRDDLRGLPARGRSAPARRRPDHGRSTASPSPCG